MSDISQAELYAGLVLKFGLATGAGIGVLFGAWSAAERSRQALAKAGHVDDLKGRHQLALAALKQLEVERDKMPPEDYERERAALLAQGAAAMRELDGAETPPADVPTAAAGAAPSQAGADSLAAALKSLQDAGVELTPEQVAQLAAKHMAAAPAQPAPAPAQPAKARPAPPPVGLAPEVKGAMWTLGGAAFIGLLLYAMQGSVHERGSGPMTGGESVMGGGAAAAMAPQQRQQQQQAPALDPQTAQQKADFEAALMADQNDLTALNGLTEIAFVERDLGAAMQRNGRALELAPDDATARTYKAALRSAVGLNDGALEILNEVLKDNPTFTKALVYKGMTTMDLGKYDEAAAAFAKAIEVEGPDPFLQEKLDQATALAKNPNAAPPRRGPPPGMGGQRPGMGGPPAANGPVSSVASGNVALAPGATAPPGSILYVSLRSPAGGPPLAAKKFPASSLPMSFEITTADAISMGGPPRPFPDAMALSARIDLDGNAMTKEAGAPQATVQIQKGASGLNLTLAP